MTVCVASIFQGNSILGASDRMLTSGSGDVEFEPPQSKIKDITNSIALLIAGDIGLHSEIIQEITPFVVNRINTDKGNWIKVKEIAELYSQTYYRIRMNYAEKKILFPVGLDRNNFIERQKLMSDAFIEDLKYKLQNYQMPNVSSIITGLDTFPNGVVPHIYTFHNGYIQCCDDVGFAAIGVGYNHANSQFMFMDYTKTATGAEASLAVYWAKKRAEVAPGVGKATDMFTMGPSLGTFLKIPNNIVDDLEKIYQKNKLSIEKSNLESKESIQNYLDRLQKQQNQMKDQSDNPERTER